MANTRKGGILSSDSNPVTDANVIMTAAVIGHAYQRIRKGHNCRFDLEIKDPTNPQTAELEGLTVHRRIVQKINAVLAGAGLKSDEMVKIGVSPAYDRHGKKTTITGGTGNQALNSDERYDPPANWSNELSEQLYQLAFGNSKDGQPTGIKLGYQGSGAYTGFVADRDKGQNSLMSTYRFKVPEKDKRWVPDNTTIKKYSLGAELGTDDTQRKAWGIILNNKVQNDLRDKQGMYFQDEDKARDNAATLTDADVVGYVHGLIQAIYAVEFNKEMGEAKPGTPYEIAVGETTKRSSCFTCSLFMEATGYPASSTHLGRGESWCTLHPDEKSVTRNRAMKRCNDLWAGYCATILQSGVQCLGVDIQASLNESHHASFKELSAYVKNKEPYALANLILDAVTVHNNEYKRVDAALK